MPELYAISGICSIDGSVVSGADVIISINGDFISTTTSSDGAYVFNLAEKFWNNNDEFIIEVVYTNTTTKIDYLGVVGGYINTSLAGQSDLNVAIGRKEYFENFVEVWKTKGRKVTITSNTKTVSNISGDPEYVSVSKIRKHIFIERVNKSVWLREGSVETGDAVLIVPYPDTVTNEDTVTVDSKVFRVDSILPKLEAGIGVNKTCVLNKEV